MEAPQSPVDAAATPPQAPRGGCLTAWLVLMIIVGLGVSLVYFLRPDSMMTRYPRLSRGGVVLLGVATFANVVLAILIWNWRRVGVWGFIALAVLVFPFNLYIGVSLLPSLIGLVGPAILVALVWPKWSSFK
jgi:uncharacterized membrane protein